MKKNNILAFLKNPLLYIVLLSIVIQNIVYRFFDSYSVFNDTYSYIDGYTQNIFKGEVNNFRTPIYPYFCKIIKLLFGKEKLYNNIVLVQKMLFVFSIVIFYMAMKKIFNSKITYCIVTIFYSLSPFLFMWNTIILSESITIFEFVLLLYFIISYINKPNKKDAFLVGIIILLMVMTRPSNLFLLGLYLLFLIAKLFFNKEEKKCIISGLISSLISIIVILLYCNQIRVQYGVFNISSVTNVNNFMIITNSGVYTYGDDEEIIDCLNDISNETIDQSRWDDLNNCMYQHDTKEITNFIKIAKRKSGIRYYIYFIKRFLGIGPSSLGVIYAYGPKDNNHIISTLSYTMLPLSFTISYYIFAISFIFICYYYFKFKKIDWIAILLFTIGFGNIFVSIVFAPFETERLSLLSLVVLIVLIPYLYKRIIIDNEKTPRKGKKKSN